MEKNIWEYVMNSKGEVIEKVADYIGVESFAKVIESLYRECLENFDDADDLEERGSYARPKPDIINLI